MDNRGLERPHIVKGRGLDIRLPAAERVRAAQGMAQAVAKVISFGHGAKAAGQSIDYISRKGELELETESGEKIKGREEQKELVKNWSRDFDSRKDSRDTVHMALSMPRGSDPEALRRSVRTVLTTHFKGHEAVFAIHTDRPHPHAHVVMKMRGRDKEKKLRFKKQDLFDLRQAFAEAAREQGVPLAASPRWARGVGTKAMRQSLYHLKQKLRQQGKRPEVEQQTVREALDEVSKGDWTRRPWEKAMDERNQSERQIYKEEAVKLRQAAQTSTQQTVRQQMLKNVQALEAFARMMPKPKTRREMFKEAILQKSLEDRRAQNHNQNRGMER